MNRRTVLSLFGLALAPRTAAAVPLPGLDDRIDARYLALIAEAGPGSTHCEGGRCFQGESIAMCICRCNACAIDLELYLQAHADITGREPSAEIGAWS